MFPWRRWWLLETEGRMIGEAVFKASSQAVLSHAPLSSSFFGSEPERSETAGLQPTSLISAPHTSFFHCSSSPHFIFLLQEREVTFFQPSSRDFFLSCPLAANGSKWEGRKKRKRKGKKIKGASRSSRGCFHLQVGVNGGPMLLTCACSHESRN